MFYNLKMNALACLFLMTGSAIQAAENIPPSQAADKNGSFISKTRDSIPPFPSSVRGFYYDPGKDFWGKPFQETGHIRVFEGIIGKSLKTSHILRMAVQAVDLWFVGDRIIPMS